MTYPETTHTFLVQNADDAGAKNVEIHFNTQELAERKKDVVPPPSAGVTASSSPLPDLTKVLLRHWEVRNDGIPFKEDDWKRLKKIALGNPVRVYVGPYSIASIDRRLGCPNDRSIRRWLLLSFQRYG